HNVPQKKNTALLDILSSSHSAIFGRLSEFLTELKELPLGYSQDLQESIPSLMDLVDNLKFILELTSVTLPAIQFDEKRMRDVASADLTNPANALTVLFTRGFAH